MPKTLIAVDIDDVIADSTEALRIMANERSGLDLPPEAYKVKRGTFWGYYEQVWAEHGVDKHYTFAEHKQDMEADQSSVFPVVHAIESLRRLSEVYRIVFITSREESWRPATMRWLATHFSELSFDIHFLGHQHENPSLTKGQLCRELGAELLIDDSEENCRSAVEEGLGAIRFGDYGWHGDQLLVYPACRNWRDVLEYLSV